MEKRTIIEGCNPAGDAGRGAREARDRQPCRSGAPESRAAFHQALPGGRARIGARAGVPDLVSARAAERTLMLLLKAAACAARAAPGSRPAARKDQRHRWRAGEPGLAGRTLGIVGFGRVGRAVARQAHRRFGMRIAICDSSPVAAEDIAELAATQTRDLDALLPQCDFVSLHCPGGAATRHLINARRLNLMKPGAFLINTARAECINETALFHALAFETIGGAALDVFEGGAGMSPDLLDCDRLVTLSHGVGGLRAFASLQTFLEGQIPAGRPN